jgi:hypothetical protein
VAPHTTGFRCTKRARGKWRAGNPAIRRPRRATSPCCVALRCIEWGSSHGTRSSCATAARASQIARKGRSVTMHVVVAVSVGPSRHVRSLPFWLAQLRARGAVGVEGGRLMFPERDKHGGCSDSLRPSTSSVCAGHARPHLQLGAMRTTSPPNNWPHSYRNRGEIRDTEPHPIHDVRIGVACDAMTGTGPVGRTMIRPWPDRPSHRSSRSWELVSGFGRLLLLQVDLISEEGVYEQL